MSGKGHLFSQIFKPIATARRHVKMKRIACTSEGVKMVTSIDMRGRAGVLFFKTTKTTLNSFFQSLLKFPCSSATLPQFGLRRLMSSRSIIRDLNELRLSHDSIPA